jgi:tryptophan synthase alpha chain
VTTSSDPRAAKLAHQWSALRAAHRTALIPYVTGGYPTRETTIEALHMLEAEGADIVEVGVPFSDPLADGPTIQRSSFEALRTGTTVAGVLAMIREAALSIPVVVFSYLNPLLRYGMERFVADAVAAGASGLLLTDVPVGADPAVEGVVRASALDRIPLVALTTAPHRLHQAAAGGSGFVYLISRLGVTGAPTTVSTRIEQAVAGLRAVTALPVAVGFGIGTGTQAASVAQFADGVVVGSALVERLGQGIAAARELTTELRQALDGAAVPS